MKTILIMIALGLTGCGHFHATKSSKKSVAQPDSYVRDMERLAQQRAERDSIIAGRVKSYERQGMLNGEARAAAQAEYTLQGGPVPSVK